MIELKSLTKNHNGRGVIYNSPGGDKRESGVITSWNGSFIFVRYGSHKQSAATRPEDLSWEF